MYAKEGAPAAVTPYILEPPSARQINGTPDGAEMSEHVLLRVHVHVG